jgi:hypothetical protein
VQGEYVPTLEIVGAEGVNESDSQQCRGRDFDDAWRDRRGHPWLLHAPPVVERVVGPAWMSNSVDIPRLVCWGDLTLVNIRKRKSPSRG